MSANERSATTLGSAIVAGMLLAAGSFAAENEPASITLNLHLTPTSFDCSAFGALESGSCEDVASDPVPGPAFLWVVASALDGFGDLIAPRGASTIAFGIEHDLEIEEWTSCGDLSIPTETWPSSGSSNAVSWPGGCREIDGQNAVVGYFTLSEGASGSMSLVADSRIGSISFTDCTSNEILLCANAGATATLATGTGAICNSDLTLPNPPASVTATTDTCVVTVAWSHDGVETDAFTIRRDGQTVATLGAEERTFVDTGVSASGGVYDYQVSAFSSCGAQAQSELVSGAVPSTPAAENCVATRNMCDRIVVSWSDESANELGFDIFRAGGVIATVPPNATTYEDFSAPAAVDIPYAVIALGPCARAPLSNVASGFRPELPFNPGSVEAVSGLCELVVLSWEQNSIDHVGFTIYRDGDVLVELPRVARAYRDSSAQSGVTYAYVVEAEHVCGGAPAAPVNATAGSDPPSPPTGLIASEDLCFVVELEWQDASLDEEGFRVLRDGVAIAQLGAGETAFVDSSAVIGIEHVYTIEPFNACGTGAPSSADVGIRLPDGPMIPAVTLLEPTSDQECILSPVSFTWEEEPDAVEYNVQVLFSCTGDVIRDRFVTDTNFATTIGSGTYAWRVRAKNDCGAWWDWSECRPFTVEPPDLDAPYFLDYPTPVDEDAGLWHTSWTLIEGADSYRLVVGSFGCYEWYETPHVLSVAGTDTTFHEGKGLYFYVWVYAFGCVASDSVDCWTNDPGPAVLLEYFTATPLPEGVALDWRTTHEQNTQGFNLYRTGEGDVRRRANESLIAGGQPSYVYLDTGVRLSGTYTYTLSEVETDGREKDIAVTSVTVIPVAATSVLALRIRPNPFNPRATIELRASRGGRALVDVLDASGRRVARLLDSAIPRGVRRLTWDGIDAAGRPLASGVYFVTVSVGTETRAQRITLIR